MKTIRVIGIALVAILMSAGFSACSNDEPSANGSATTGKKLVAASLYNGDLVIVFSYDQNGRLVSSESQEREFSYTWLGDALISQRIGGSRYTFSLKNGFVEKIVEGDMSYDLTYDSSKKLNKVVRHYGEKRQMSCVWDGDKLKQIDIDDSYSNYSLEFTYSDMTCKGYSPVHNFVCANYLFDHDVFMAHPEIVGLKTNQLVTKFVERNNTMEFSYTFTEDGYVESCTLSETRYDGSSRNQRVKFTWK